MPRSNDTQNDFQSIIPQIYIASCLHEANEPQLSAVRNDIITKISPLAQKDNLKLHWKTKLNTGSIKCMGRYKNHYS